MYHFVLLKLESISFEVVLGFKFYCRSEVYLFMDPSGDFLATPYFESRMSIG